MKEYVLFLVCFDLFIGGPETVYEWDREKEIPAGLRDFMGFLHQRLPALLDLGAEMWPMEQATVYFRWARGLAHPYGDLIVVTYDASEKGIAAVIIMEPERFCAWKECTLKGCLQLSLFESTPEAQVHQEAVGAPMVIRLLQRLRLAPAS